MPPDPGSYQLRRGDGSAGDANYAVIGAGYTRYRQADGRIRTRVEAQLGTARTVVNVGAGAGAYEPADRVVVAVEPSRAMRRLRPAQLGAVVDAVAERLPFGDASFDAALSTFSVHQWSDCRAGVREMRRVARERVVILTCDPLTVRRFWLYDYAPEVLDVEARRYPPIADLADMLGGRVRIDPVPIPLDCTDGFNEAYYGRPEQLLDPGARQACSAWSLVDARVHRRFQTALANDLRSGRWNARYGLLRSAPWYAGSLVLVIGEL